MRDFRSTYRRLFCRRWCFMEIPWLGRSYVLICMAMLFTIMLVYQAMAFVMHSHILRCYRQEGNLLEELNEDEVPIATSFFFHETSCSEDAVVRDIPLHPRQACAVESAALHHPSNDVYLLFVSPVMVRLNETRNMAVHGLLTYSNIKIRHINFDRYMGGTPLHSLRWALQYSKWPISHASDVLRYTTLYKFRGTYLDLDVIVLKPFNQTNIVGAESNRSLGAGVINFGSNEVGEEMADNCATELQRSFDGSNWGKNGPGVITRVLQERCDTYRIQDMISRGECKGFNVLPVHAFYAFPFWHSDMFFKPGRVKYAKRLLRLSLVIHFWGKVSSKYSLPKEDVDVPFLYYARQHCPKVYEAVGAGMF